ncbi:MAG: class B sortase [Eubacterium sp.]|nr:class B sortase [Eubacterium sp.]
MKRKIYLVICIVFALVFVVSSAGVAITLYGYQKADKAYDDLQNRFVIEKPHETEQAPNEEVTPEETAPISVDFGSLMRENSDIIGWLYCENTPIHYPVVQADDNDYYLRRDLHGEYLKTGTLFADYRCPAVGTGQNHIIYGHNMKNASMFGTLVNYKEQKYFEEHPVLYYLTPETNYKIDLFAGFTADADSDIYRTEIGNTEEFEAFLQKLTANSTFKSDVDVTGSDHIIMLSTCSYEFDNARYIVFGKLTPLSSTQ